MLHTLKYGDSSMVAYLLTDVGGRRSYMVQGVRSRSGRGSKLALFQPMFPVEFEGLESSRQQMDRFKEVRAGFVLQSLPFDVRKSTMALFMAEVLYRLVRESEPNEPLFRFRVEFGRSAGCDGRRGFEFSPLVPGQPEPPAGLPSGQRLYAGGVVRHPRGVVYPRCGPHIRG